MDPQSARHAPRARAALLVLVTLGGLPSIAATQDPPQKKEAKAEDTPPVTLSVRRADGATLRCRVAPRPWPFVHRHGTLRIPLTEIDQVEPLPGGTPAAPQLRLRLLGGDLVTGVWQEPAPELRDTAGAVVPWTAVKTLTLVKPTNLLPRHGLLLHFACDTLRDTAIDSSGFNQHGQLVGARLERCDGRWALAFDGQADKGSAVRVRHSPLLARPSRTGAISVAMWIKVRSEPVEFPVLLCKGGNFKPAWGGLELHLNTHKDNDLQITSGAFTAVTYRAFGKWIDKRLGTWIHVAVTLQRGGKAIFYVDGKATGDTFTYKSSSNQALAAETRDLYLGAPDPDHHTNRSWFDGWMDEVRIYDRVLRPEEVLALFEFGR